MDHATKPPEPVDPMCPWCDSMGMRQRVLVYLVRVKMVMTGQHLYSCPRCGYEEIGPLIYPKNVKLEGA
jgi:hypothetical protein